MAVPVTQANKRQLEALKQRRAEREAHEFNTMSELAKGVSKLICVVKVKTGEDGKIFGTVTTGMIADELKHQFDISLDKRKIHMDHPIRALGEHEIELRLHAEVKAMLKVRVESTTPLPTPAETAAAEAAKKEKEARPERRGHRGDIYAKSFAKPGAEKTEAAEPKPHAAKAERPARAERAARPEKPAKPSKAE
jgi:large subunit ribosomal protein L9